MKQAGRVGQVFAAHRFVGCCRWWAAKTWPTLRRCADRTQATCLIGIVVILCACHPCLAEALDVPALTAAINAVGPEGTGHAKAIAACRRLVQADAAQIPEILAGMDKSGKLSANWLRGTVEAIVQRELTSGNKLPQAELERFLADVTHAPRPRRLAYELIRRVDPSAERRLISGFLNDPSLELRRDAVAYALAEGNAVLEKGDKKNAIAAYRRALTAARDMDQIDQVAKQLRDLGETVDLPAHFGFIRRWKLIAPFDNTNMGGFDVAYAPEPSPDVTAEYDGKEGVVRWIDATTDDQYGNVDLNKILGKLKGAIAYACVDFVAEKELDAEFRLGCTNANKLWVNGHLLFANEVYHTGFFIDQYVGKGRLKKGKNTILLKIAQNEQEENWAQNWQLQFRVCDQYGTAILSKDRDK